MQIIIVGCGKVGRTLAERLSAEDHNLILVDLSAERLRPVTDALDVMGVVGNGASIQVLMDAGIEQADLLIAVTASDELNLLCCLIAKRASGGCQTIARVRNPLYNQEIGFIKEQLGISMVINPELTAANEIARLLRFPSAIKIDSFAKGRAELLTLKLRPEFGLDGESVVKMVTRLRSRVLVCAVERGDKVFIPNGSFVLHDGDSISILATPQDAAAFFQKLGVEARENPQYPDRGRRHYRSLSDPEAHGNGHRCAYRGDQAGAMRDIDPGTSQGHHPGRRRHGPGAPAL